VHDSALGVVEIPIDTDCLLLIVPLLLVLHLLMLNPTVQQTQIALFAILNVGRQILACVEAGRVRLGTNVVQGSVLRNVIPENGGNNAIIMDGWMDVFVACSGTHPLAMRYSPRECPGSGAS
jgi:hypothetical protein